MAAERDQKNMRPKWLTENFLKSNNIMLRLAQRTEVRIEVLQNITLCRNQNKTTYTEGELEIIEKAPFYEMKL